ncbi:hypothetical protein BCT41_24650 [Vibrio splendidus]|uniref:DUF6988 family protein n=1 Tax=Vibrio TaxID=662 RepID=UPI000C85E3FC|nr:MULTISPECIES: hypothetical protein [Vibrio]PMN14453.1 hypothetical protein BCT41_24650 [Vibrio splendidus]TKF03656.1 hypothetical protein FCV46_12380 [Vibrio kanaloae]TKF64543.1 hypothetical protein FCV51_03300 [Vibrio kanaloae]
MKNKTQRWTQSFKSLTSKLTVKANDRTRLALGLMYTSNEHGCSIYELSVINIPSSAFALLRAQLEAHIRGLWVAKCATIHQINEIYGGKQFPQKNDMLNAITKLEEFKDGVFKQKVNDMWGLLCDFTHGGGVQGAWHIGRHGVGSYFEKKQIDTLYGLTCKISYLNSIAMAKVCRSEQVATKLTDSYRRIHK